jgi:hypothetical protein
MEFGIVARRSHERLMATIHMRSIFLVWIA